MRRYIRHDNPTKTKTAKRTSRSTRSTFLSLDELQDIPEAYRVSAVPTKPTKKLAKKSERTDCVDPVFTNQYAPGAKTLRYRRSKSQPLMTFDDRLNRVDVLDVAYSTFDIPNNKVNITIWKVAKPVVHDVNLHLVDKEADEADREIRYIIQMTLFNRSFEKYLIPTEYGYICPKCRTNEFIKSHLKNMPISIQDANWYVSEYDQFCENCQTISE